jgi:outer membrane assembly lipoprotein YfiO
MNPEPFFNLEPFFQEPPMTTLSRIAGSIAVSLCLLAACASTGTSKIKPHRYNCSAKVAQAVKKYKEGHFASVKTLLDDVKLQCAGHEVMDSAEYYLAMSLMNMKDYPEAKVEFTRLAQDFPKGPFYDEAQFRIGYCVFKSSRGVDRDQAETSEAVKLLRDYVETNAAGPFADSAQKYMILATDKLAEKEFNSANFYRKIGEKEAAIVTYRTFVNDYPGSKYAVQAQLSMGQVLLELGRAAEAREALETLVAKEKQGDYVKKAQELLARLGAKETKE